MPAAMPRTDHEVNGVTLPAGAMKKKADICAAMERVAEVKRSAEATRIMADVARKRADEAKDHLEKASLLALDMKKVLKRGMELAEAAQFGVEKTNGGCKNVQDLAEAAHIALQEFGAEFLRPPPSRKNKAVQCDAAENKAVQCDAAETEAKRPESAAAPAAKWSESAAAASAARKRPESAAAVSKVQPDWSSLPAATAKARGSVGNRRPSAQKRLVAIGAPETAEPRVIKRRTAPLPGDHSHLPPPPPPPPPPQLCLEDVPNREEASASCDPNLTSSDCWALLRRPLLPRPPQKPPTRESYLEQWGEEYLAIEDAPDDDCDEEQEKEPFRWGP